MLNFFLCICLFSTALSASQPEQVLEVPRPDGRIVGGRDANIEAFPYMLSITYNGVHSCGAALISDTWALTGANCVSGLNVSELAVQANSSIVEKGVSVPVKNVTIHEKFHDLYLYNDIAVLKLNESLSCANCKPIKLRRFPPITFQKVRLLGWGTYDLEHEYEISNVLQTVKVPVVNKYLCAKLYAGVWGGITKNVFCAGYLRGGVDSCEGDGGGPVSLGGKLVGIVSWGNGCARRGYPGVYTSVCKYRSWIREKTGLDV